MVPMTPMRLPLMAAISATGSSMLIMGMFIRGRIILVAWFTEVQVTMTPSAPEASAALA
mgnify:CR=1 FL=1